MESLNIPLKPTDIFFYIFSGLALVLALRVVLGKNPISCAFSLVGVFFCVAANYALMHAHFIAALQILVYAGAVMVLFIFVIMLLNADVRNLDVTKSKKFKLISLLLSISVLGLFSYSIHLGSVSTQKSGLNPEKINELGGNVQAISEVLFSDYILPFELTSILLLIGIAGSVSLAKRKMEAK